MLTPHTAARPARRAFTLIELLVAISILAFLAGLSVLVITNLDGHQPAPAGASQVHQMLMAAKQRAVRDRRQHGVRLSVKVTQDPRADPTDPSRWTRKLIVDPHVATLQHVDQADDFAVQPGVDPVTSKALPFRRISVLASDDPQRLTVKLETNGGTGDFSGGQGTTDTEKPLWPVQAGDYLEINGCGLPRRITSVGFRALPTAPWVGTQLTLLSPLPFDVGPTGHYRIIRAARPSGDDPLQLPEGVAIDVSTDQDATTGAFRTLPLELAPPLPGTVGTATTATIDILFAPAGPVVGLGTASDLIYLWVRDTGLPLYQGDNTLVVVYTRSGGLAAHPVDSLGQSGGDPYTFAKAGRASGL